MNAQPMANHFKPVNQNTSINTLLESFRNKVRNFSVTDNQGEIVGKVKDLILDANHRLNLVISQQVNQTFFQDTTVDISSERLVLLLSKKIKKIDDSVQSILLEIDKSEVELMPEYLEQKTPHLQRKVDELNHTNSNKQMLYSQSQTGKSAEGEDENIVRLLEERLIAEHSKRKIGEVIVRKEIQTRMVQVPVRSEKLIIEQVSPENKQLAEIDLSQGETSGVQLMQKEKPLGTVSNGHLTVSGEFSSPKIASLLLNAIALEQNHGCQHLQITIAVTDESLQKKYQEWFARCSQGHKP
ncbi:DUF2382 domain-containing protein [Umezakia ovalisporum]|jgi:sporulation protein YlmC with PRC-barrel domain|nr:DUF2382 domain-containing protein [Umezakia ovalisporum]MDH6056322.1 DUF2382 domain-containing protein [Umezakia ovalisporum FSS-43]MDH6068839.1 DUF2382 domain-containing protein [Umezakia ovalisporum APH033B]MDH6071031.1 DUF2382 domain-containing protein [Umezakia ovalisporum CobakiLakeA]MDH6072904.1 DUF2382 domain-containing protein [Umezakia ovalisporum CS-1034]MDH6077255.1 DUF2382 domain-containing protein [Umezakia ovalisporum FSS-45]